MKVEEIEVERLDDLPRAKLLLNGMRLHGSQLRLRLHKPGLLPPAAQEKGCGRLAFL